MSSAICPVITPHAAPLRLIQVSCRCLNHMKRNEPAPSEPLALVQYEAQRHEADAVDHLARAVCFRNSIEARRDESLQGQLDAAWRRQRAIEQIAAQHWGVAIAIDHAV